MYVATADAAPTAATVVANTTAADCVVDVAAVLVSIPLYFVFGLFFGNTCILHNYSRLQSK